MSRPPCTILSHFPQAPKRTPLFLLNSFFGDTLDYLASYRYYPSFEVRNFLRRIHGIKAPILDAFEHTLFGLRSLPNSSSHNRCFFLLEHIETRWMKLFVSFLMQNRSPSSLIWLHDGIWVAPAPSRHLIDAAN